MPLPPAILDSIISHLPAGSTAESCTLDEYLQAQKLAEAEARQVLDGNIDVCSYEAGSVRQDVYACRDCKTEEGELAGFCFACSIRCHSDHEIYELFPKRNFRCDCPTTVFPNQSCALLSSAPTLSIPRNPSSRTTRPKHLRNESNTYDHNYIGRFCVCDDIYEPEKREEGTMLQCLVCEDWFHETCLKLLAPSEPSALPSLSSSAAPLNPSSNSISNNPHTSLSETSTPDHTPTSSHLTPADPLLTDEDYSTLICSSCVLSRPSLRDLLSRSEVGSIVVLPKSSPKQECEKAGDEKPGRGWADRWQVVGRLEEKKGEVKTRAREESVLKAEEDVQGDVKKRKLEGGDGVSTDSVSTDTALLSHSYGAEVNSTHPTDGVPRPFSAIPSSEGESHPSPNPHKRLRPDPSCLYPSLSPISTSTYLSEAIASEHTLGPFHPSRSSVKGPTNKADLLAQLAKEKSAREIELARVREKTVGGGEDGDAAAVVGLPRVDLFLAPGWRERICRCEKHLAMYESDKLPYLLEEEVTWAADDDEGEEDEVDADAQFAQLLQTLPREATINAVQGFQNLSSALTAHLHSLPPTTVFSAEDVKAFFDEFREKQRRAGGGGR